MNEDIKQKASSKSLKLPQTLDMRLAFFIDLAFSTRRAFFMQRTLLLCLLFLTVSCSVLTQYSISNTVPTEFKSENGSGEDEQQAQATFSEVINRTPFPNLTFVMEQNSKEVGSKCQNYIFELSLTHPLILDQNSVLGQSRLELKLVKPDLIPETVFVSRELLTFSLTQGVNEESLLQSALMRLLDRVILWCIPKD